VTLLARKVGCKGSKGRSWSKEWIARRKQALQENIGLGAARPGGLVTRKKEARNVDWECTFTIHGTRTFFSELQQALLRYRTETDELAFISDMKM
jgi:hypothetical protein